MKSVSCDITAQGVTERLADINNFKMVDSFDYNIILNELGNVCGKGFDGLKSYCQELNNVIGKCMWKEDYDKLLRSIFCAPIFTAGVCRICAIRGD
jgi:hypothetical protein